MTCTYIPHVSLKSFNLIDFVNYVDDDKKDMYVLQCSQGMTMIWINMTVKLSSDFDLSFVPDTDPFTHHISDWQGRRSLSL